MTQKSGQTSPHQVEWFESPADAEKQLAAVGYLSDAATSTTTYLAGALEKPCSSRGLPGVGKTELAKAVARATGAELVRLQCYEGLDEARALYEWNYKKQLLRIQAAGDQSWDETHDDIFTDEFLLTRPLLTAIRREEPTVLLIDEVDKTDVEVEGLLLEMLSDFQVTIPEMGTIAADAGGRSSYSPPTRRASSPRRSSAAACSCTSTTPRPMREREIVVSQVPEVEEQAGRADRRGGRPSCAGWSCARRRRSRRRSTGPAPSSPSAPARSTPPPSTRPSVWCSSTPATTNGPIRELRLRSK